MHFLNSTFFSLLMNAFTTAAATLLSRYSVWLHIYCAGLISFFQNNLLKEESENALSGELRGDESVYNTLIECAVFLIDSFNHEDFLVCGLHRTNGSIVQQQRAMKILEHASTPELVIIHVFLSQNRISLLQAFILS